MQIVRRLSLLGAVSTTAGGVLSYLQQNNPSGFTDWSSLSALFQEYRVLALKLTWIPLYTHWGTTTAQGWAQNIAIIYPWRDAGATAPATATAAFSIDGSKILELQKRTSIEIRMSNTLEAQYQNTRTPGSTFALGIYGASNVASTVLGNITAEILVQFRAAL